MMCFTVKESRLRVRIATAAAVTCAYRSVLASRVLAPISPDLLQVTMPHALPVSF